MFQSITACWPLLCFNKKGKTSCSYQSETRLQNVIAMCYNNYVLRYARRLHVRHDLALGNNGSSCYLLSWAHVVKPSSRFVLYTLDNIQLILLHGGSDTELTFNSDYCCRRFLVEPSRTSLFFEQCLLLYSSVVTARYHLWKLPSSHFSLLCEIRRSSYTSIPSSGTKCLTLKLPMALPVLKLQKILAFIDPKSPHKNHSRSMAIAPTTGSCGNNDG